MSLDLSKMTKKVLWTCSKQLKNSSKMTEKVFRNEVLSRQNLSKSLQNLAQRPNNCSKWQKLSNMTKNCKNEKKTFTRLVKMCLKVFKSCSRCFKNWSKCLKYCLKWETRVQKWMFFQFLAVILQIFKDNVPFKPASWDKTLLNYSWRKYWFNESERPEASTNNHI